MVGSKVEAGGIAKDGAKTCGGRVQCQRAEITVVIGGSFGAGNYGMCGRAFGPRMMWMWPNARISVMGGPQAAGVLRTVKDAQRETAGEPPLSEEEAREITDPVLQKYETEGSAWFASARLWDDGVIDPENPAVLAGPLKCPAINHGLTDPIRCSGCDRMTKLMIKDEGDVRRMRLSNPERHNAFDDGLVSICTTRSETLAKWTDPCGGVGFREVPRSVRCRLGVDATDGRGQSR